MDNKIIYPKVLAISINAFSKEGSNGKVFSELFCDWETDKIAQFYVANELPNFDVCKNYYRITDNEAKNAFLGKKPTGKKIETKAILGTQNTQPTTKKTEKNPLTRLLRDIIWNSGRWKNKDFYNWIDEFNPQIIVMMGTSSSFIPKITMDIAKRKNIPIVIFNTEDYYFKNYNYMKNQRYSIFFWPFKIQSKIMFRRLMKMSSYEIYNSDMLKSVYYEEFGKKSDVIYQPTSLETFEKKEKFENKFTYLGNLGLNRHKSLIEIGNTLQEISNDYFLDVYGRAPNEEVEKMLLSAKGVRFHGFIKYDEVKEKIKQSDILFHTESFEPFYITDLRGAFSTKISDSLISGRCFLLYANEKIACAKYLLENECAAVITKPEELKSKLEELINNEQLRDRYIDKALVVAKENHNAKTNCEKMRNILCELVGNKDEDMSD